MPDSIYEGLTQEELVTEINTAFWEETGLSTTVSDLSDLIDTHAADDEQHWQMISFLEFVLRMVRDRHG